MFPFENRIISSNIARFRVILEKRPDGDIQGTLYNDSYGFAIDFQGIRQMLSNLDDFFDSVNFPQATHEKRSFSGEPAQKEKCPPRGFREVSREEMQGLEAVLLLHVQFRQNSTWQGTLTWLAEKKTKRFRSELEMIGLLTETIKSKK